MNIIRDKIDKFIRKYYSTQILTGFIVLTGIFLLLILITALIEYYAWLSISGRAILFWTTISISVLIFIILILVPTFKLLKLGKVISYSDAAKIIGKFFPEIKDKLQNYLQLEELQDSSSSNYDLIIASINQKINDLKPFNYSKAVDFHLVIKCLKYVVPVIIIFLTVIIAKPAVIKKPTERIINYTTKYVKPQPYYLTLLNTNLNVVQNEDYTVTFSITGTDRPDNVTLNFKEDGHNKSANTYMVKVNDTTYNYTFKDIQSNITFYASSNNISSESYTLEVYPQPVLLGFNLNLEYPNYTGRSKENIENTGLLKILYGTSGLWTFSTKDADGLIVIQNNRKDTIRNDRNKRSTYFTMKSYFTNDDEISVIAFNKYMTSKDTLKYIVQIIKDLSPDIQVVEARDTLLNRDLFFNGNISDDYGFSSLKFYYRTIHSDDQRGGTYWSQDVPFSKSITIQKFLWRVNIDDIGLQPGEGMEYYFEVCDNDAAKGYKCSSSQLMSYKKMTANEINQLSDKVNEQIKENLNTSMNTTDNIDKQIEDYLKEMKEKENMSYQDKEKLQKLLDKQKNLQKKIEDQQEQMKINNLNQNEYNNFSEEIQEKQKKIEELYNKILNEDLKKMIEDLQKMIQEFNKDKMDSQLRDYQLKNEDLEKQLDQTLELYKNLEFEQEMEKTTNKLDSLAKKQEELSKKTEKSSKKDMEKLSEEQKKINNEFDNAKVQMDKLEDLNKNLEKQLDINFNDPKIEETEKELEKSSEKLDKKNNDASKNQKNAAQDMNDLSTNLKNQYEKATAEQQEEDESAVRRLLENVLHLSFKEEQLMDELHKVQRGNPKYMEIIHRQNEINTQLSLIEDTLKSIAKRNFQISSFVFNELSNLKNYSKLSTKNLTDRNVSQASNNLQQTMNSLNVFALMLSESLDNMDDQMSNSSSCPNGKKKRKTGSNGKPSMQTIKDLQQQLNQQMKEMQKNMSKEGSPNPIGKPGNSEQFAKMAMQQEAIRRQLEEMQQNLRSEGQGMDNGLQQAIDKMEQNENDLINKKLTDQMMNRQQEIMTRLLESEKAHKQRGEDNQRESTTAKDIIRKSPEEIFNIDTKNTHNNDALKTVPPNLNNYYKQKVDKYRFNLK